MCNSIMFNFAFEIRVELITIVMSGVVVHSVYKPPNDQFALPALGHRDLPHIVIGDFNSHMGLCHNR